MNDTHSMDIGEMRKQFFEHLRSSQESIVSVALSKYKPGDSLEELLFDVTYDAVFDVMKLIDGYTTSNIRLDLIDRRTGVSIKEDIELHDECADYLHP